MGQVGAIVEDQAVPAVGGVGRVKVEAAVRLAGALQGVEAVVVASCAVCDVPGRGGILQAVGILLALGQWCQALVDVRMARQHQVDIVLDQQRLEDVLARGAGIIGVAEVQGPCYDPIVEPHVSR